MRFLSISSGNYFLPIHCGSPDMAKKFNLNKWFCSIRKLTYPTNISMVSNIYNKNLNKYMDQYFSHYLAGLIEGDGYISITNQNKVILAITFNIKDRPLAEKLLSLLGVGSIIKRSGNSIELRFSRKKTLYNIIKLINGKFRTPKIDQLYKLIDWMNNQHSMNIQKLPINNSSILNDS